MLKSSDKVDTGSTLMGTNPRESAANKYLQNWDCHNPFVVGVNVFPHKSSYNPTGPVGALADWTADAIKNKNTQAPVASISPVCRIPLRIKTRATPTC